MSHVKFLLKTKISKVQIGNVNKRGFEQIKYNKMKKKYISKFFSYRISLITDS